MTIKETKDLLDNCLIYKLKIESLQHELKDATDDLKPMIKTEIDNLTERVMNIRCKIDSLEGHNTKLVMRFRFINGMSFKDIARKLDMSYQWINKLYNDGLEQLSKML